VEFGGVMWSTTESAGHSRRKLSANECESGNVEVQWNNIKKCILDPVGDSVGKVERRARNPWITQEIISKMDERRSGKMSTTKKEGRKERRKEARTNYRKLRNEFKGAVS
jgi:hypothetical protein